MEHHRPRTREDIVGGPVLFEHGALLVVEVPQALAASVFRRSLIRVACMTTRVGLPGPSVRTSRSGQREQPASDKHRENGPR